MFIFDEPTTGLHFHDINKLLAAFNALIERGHTIVIVEHNMDVIKCADWVVDLGPEAGTGGGRVVFEGTPRNLEQCPASYTGKYLRLRTKLSTNTAPVKAEFPRQATTMEFFTYRLPNGIRGIHRQVKSNVAHCALVINAGSRDEHPDQYGLAHLTEHAFFKGTQRRRAWQVNCRLENLGGELNAFTTKEDTTIHATTLRGDFPRAAELIADVAFRSTFPERELEREKEVIADEINTYKDSPADLIYDTFEDMLFAGSELGHNILGRKNALARYDGEAIRAFTGRTHTTDQMVFSSIGNFSAKTAEAVAARYFAGQAASARGFGRVAPAPCAAFEKTVVKHTHQTHCIIGNRAYGIGEEKRLPLALLINILGGPCANSLLNVVVREKNGLSYNIEASYTPYSDSGIVAIYFSSENGNTAQCIEPRSKGNCTGCARRRSPHASCVDGEKTVHRTAGHIEREQRRVHAGGRKKFPDARRRGYHGTGLRQSARTDRRTAHRGRRRGFLRHVETHL